MICDSCIHKDVCYVGEEDMEALTFCADYFNFVKELEKIKTEFEEDKYILLNQTVAIQIIDKRISELKLKGEQL